MPKEIGPIEKKLRVNKGRYVSRGRKKENAKKNLIKGAIGSTLVGLVGAAIHFGPKLVNNAKTDVNIDPFLSTELGDTGTHTVMQATRKYIGRYGCAQEDVILRSGDYGSETEIMPDGSTKVVVESAGPGWIDYDAASILDSNPELSTSEIRQLVDITSHALTHACKPSEFTPIEETSIGRPFFLPDGTQVIGFHGLSLKVITSDGNETFFTKIEEGAAEALAVGLDDDYSGSSAPYFVAGQVTLNVINTFSSPREVARMGQQNDVPGFVTMITGNTNPSVKDLQFVIDLYNLPFADYFMDELSAYRMVGQMERMILDYRGE